MAFYIFLIFTILWFLFMTYLSHQDGEHTGRTSRELAEKLSFLDSDINILNGKLRRLAHVVVYAVLTVLLVKNTPINFQTAETGRNCIFSDKRAVKCRKSIGKKLSRPVYQISQQNIGI